MILQQLIKPIVLDIDDRCWQNERGIESSLMSLWLSKYGSTFIEVGATSPYYYPYNGHIVIDPFDEFKESVRIDAEKYNFNGANVLSISTIEHMGREDYGPAELDPQKPIRFIDKLYKEAENFLVTFPVGSNLYLDTWLKDNHTKWNWYGLTRIRYSPALWQLNNELTIFNSQYNSPFPNGNSIILIYKNE